MQLPIDVVTDMYRLIALLDDYKFDADTDVIIKRLESALDAKVEAMEKRRVYSEYRTASDDEAKETARQKYLDLAGIRPDWQWGVESELRRQL